MGARRQHARERDLVRLHLGFLPHPRECTDGLLIAPILGIPGDHGRPRNDVSKGHHLEQLPGLVQLAPPGVPADQGIPHCDVPEGQLIEQAAGGVEEAGLGIEVEEGGGDEGVEWEAGEEEAGVEGAAVGGASEGGAGGEEEDEGVGVGGPTHAGEEGGAGLEHAPGAAGVGLEELVVEEGGRGVGMGEEEGVGVGEVGDLEQLQDEGLDVVEAIAEGEGMDLFDLVHPTPGSPEMASCSLAIGKRWLLMLLLD